MKLVIGTAQFGSNYGLANKSGELSRNEINLILKFAKKKGIKELDTAIGYGNSEKKLGVLNIRNMNVITKIPRFNGDINDLQKWIMNNVLNSCNRLGVKKLHGLLLHSPNQLLEPIGKKIFYFLELLKQKDMVENIGVSIYSPNELDYYFNNFHFDIVQAPFNIFDTRIRDSGWLNNLKRKNVKLYVRSIFLQGLLLLPSFERKPYFKKWSELNKWDEWIEQTKMKPLEACIKFVKNQDGIDRVVVGVDSLNQLEEIWNIFQKKTRLPNFNWGDVSETLISPQKWSL